MAQYLAEGQSVSKPPLFEGEDYHYWSERMKLFIKSKSLDVWHVIEYGNNSVTDSEGRPKSVNAMLEKEKETMQHNETAKLYLICALSRKEYEKVSGCSTAKQIWDTLAIAHEGTSQVKQTKISMLVHQYELFKMDEGESIESMFSRFQTITGSLKTLGKTYENEDQVRKILRSLPKRWRPKVTAIQEAKDLSKLGMDELLGSLKTHEMELDAEEPPKKRMTALKASASSSPELKSRKGRKQVQSESESESEDEGDIDDELVLMAKQFKRILRRREKFQRNRRFRRDGDDKRKQEEIICHHCKKPGHIKSDCYEYKKVMKKENEKKKNYKPKKKAMMATWEDLSSDESSSPSDDDSKAKQANLALMAYTSAGSSESESESDCSEVSHESEFLLMINMHEQLMKLKARYDSLKIKLCASEKHVEELEIQNKNLNEKVNDALEKCQERDYEIQFYKTEIERLNLKLKERPHSPPFYEKIISSSQHGSKGLGYVSKNKGKEIMHEKLIPSDLKQDLNHRFTSAIVGYENEMNAHAETSKSNMHASNYVNKASANNTKKNVNASKNIKSSMHVSNANKVKSFNTKKHASHDKSKIKFYYKYAPAHPRGPKKIWVPKKFMLPFTENHRKAWQAGVGNRFWLIATYDGEQVLVPRVYLI